MDYLNIFFTFSVVKMKLDVDGAFFKASNSGKPLLFEVRGSLKLIKANYFCYCCYFFNIKINRLYLSLPLAANF